MQKTLTAFLLLAVLTGCQAAQRCVVTPNSTVECN
ncbi:lipoprotein [Mesorhizobium sp. ZC-5]